MPRWTRIGGSNNLAQMERRRAALELYKEYHSYAEVARVMGLSDRSVAYKLIANAIADITRVPAQQVRDLEAQHLDHLTAKAMAVMNDPATGPGEVLAAIRTCVSISERRCKLLALDAATKYQVANTHQILTASPMERLQLYVTRGTQRVYWPAEMREYAERLEAEGRALPVGGGFGVR